MEIQVKQQSICWLIKRYVEGDHPKLNEIIIEMRRRTADHDVCQTCNGQGWVNYIQDSEGQELCLTCNGLGTVEKKK